MTLLRNPNSERFFNYGVGFGTCPVTTTWVGWHLTHFFSTTQGLSKLSSYMHAFDDPAGPEGRAAAFYSPRAILGAESPAVEYERRVRRCIGITSPARVVARSFEGKLPPTGRLPGHPMAAARAEQVRGTASDPL